jgi:HlyD family secretion protein
MADKIELRSEEFQEVLGDTPSWILRWGIILVASIVAILIAGSFVFKYPDTLNAEMTLTNQHPPAVIVAKTGGKLQELYSRNNDFVHAGDYIAIIENPAETKDIIQLKEYLSSFNTPDTITALPAKNLRVGNIQALYSSFYMTLTEYLEFIQLQYYPKKKEILSDKINL